MEVRAATAADYADYARLVGELAIDDPVPSAPHFAEELAARTLIAVADGGVVGYALVQHLAGVGYIRNLVSDPARRRSGVGVALMEAMRARFRAAGATTWALNVKPANTAAIGLYERFGLRTAYASQVMRMPASVALPVPRAVLAPLSPDEDPGIEARFALLPGQLASARARPSRHVLAMRREGALLGICVYMPAVPGAYPFRPVEGADAVEMIALLRTYALIEATFMQAVVEDDEPLAQRLRDHGAYLQLELLHLRGAI